MPTAWYFACQLDRIYCMVVALISRLPIVLLVMLEPKGCIGIFVIHTNFWKDGSYSTNLTSKLFCGDISCWDRRTFSFAIPLCLSGWFAMSPASADKVQLLLQAGQCGQEHRAAASDWHAVSGPTQTLDSPALSAALHKAFC